MADLLATYPFPSNVHVMSYVTLKLNDNNYIFWKTQFESLLSSQNLVGFVNGSVTPPPTTYFIVNGDVTFQAPNPHFEAWFRSDMLVRSWLFGTLSEEVLGSVHNLPTSRDVWLSLAENFNKRGFYQHQPSSNTSKESLTCQICGGIGHTTLKCENMFGNNYQAFSSLQISEDSAKVWYPDSGASAHVTSTTSNLKNATPYDGNDTMMVADGTFLPIMHGGFTTPASDSGTITLKYVLVCPEIRKSLLSMSKIYEDFPCGFSFVNNKVCIINQETQKMVSKDLRCNGLYVLENQEFVTFYYNRQFGCGASEEVWHYILGHSNSWIL